jgi:4-amino-4-deoxy-L-arabinose transferase-like glycosyltransferase
MDMWVDLFHLIYPVIIFTTFFVLALGIHLLCQYFVQSHPDKKNFFRALELVCIALSAYPYFLLGSLPDPFPSWVRAVVSLPLIFFIPGFLIFTLLDQKITRLERITGFTEVIFIQVLISTLISGCIGLALAQLGLFSLFYVDLVIISGCVIIIGIFKPSWNNVQFPQQHSGKTTYALIVILLLALALFFHPSPWIFGGRDPGVYVNTGVNIANTGAIITIDPFLGNMNNHTQNLFYQIEKNPAVLRTIKYQGIQFPGFYITNAQTGEVIPQFFHLWPVWIALFYSIFGLETALYITPVFALFSVLSIFLVGKHLYNTSAGLIAGLILIVNFAQIWYARYPTSEIFTMFIIFSGIFAFLIYIRNNSPFYSCLAAICFGELLLTRIDSVLIVIPSLVYIICTGILGKFRKDHLAYLISFFLLGIYAAVAALVISAPYTFDVIKIFPSASIASGDTSLLFGFLGIVLLIIAIALIYLKSKYSIALHKISMFFNNIATKQRVVVFIQVSVALFLTVYVIYNYFIRPSGSIESDTYNLVKLSWYTAGLVGISATVMGIIVLIGKKPVRGSIFFLSVFGIFAVYQLLSSNISSDQPWWIRRYLPIVIPSMIICMGCCFAWLCSRDLFNGKYQDFRCGLACILLILIIIPQGISDSAIVFPNEYNNATLDIHNIANEFPPDAIIVYKRNAYTDKIITPLHYVYNRTTVQYTSSESFPSLIKWIDSGRTVYLVDVFEPDDILSYPEGDAFTSIINWTSFEGVTFPGMRINNYYNYVVIPQLPRMENHTLNIIALNRTNILTYNVLLEGNWYDRESWQSIPTRWIPDNATFLYISDKNCTVNLTFSAKSLYVPRTLLISSGETNQIRQTISPSFGKVSVLIPIKTGKNTIRLDVPEGCKRPVDTALSQNNDTRCLSIAIQNVTLTQRSELP